MANVNQEDIKQGRVYLDPTSNTSTRIWVYENDLGTVHKDTSKYSVLRMADDDLRGAVLDQYTEFTAEGRIRRFHYAPHFKVKENNRLMQMVKEANKRARYYKELYLEQQESREAFNDLQKDLVNTLHAEMSEREIYLRKLRRILKISDEQHQ